jgi:hypothetical protein
MQPVCTALPALFLHALLQAKPKVQQAAAGWRPAGPAAAKNATTRQAASKCTDIFQQQQQQQQQRLSANEQRAGSQCSASSSSRGLQAAATAAVGSRAKQQVCMHDHLIRREVVLQAWQLAYAIIDDWIAAACRSFAAVVVLSWYLAVRNSSCHCRPSC